MGQIGKGSTRTLGFDLQTLEVFAIVCRTGSMTTAAGELGLTQPAISRAIGLLENKLDAPLFQRSSRPLKPTTAGRRLLSAANQIVGEALALPGVVRGGSGKLLPQLRLGILDSLSDPFVPQVTSATRTISQSLTVITGNDNLLRDAFLRHELDAIVSSSSFDELNGFERFELLRENYIMVMPASEQLFTDETALRDLASRSPFIRLEATSNMGRTIERHLRRIRLVIPETFSCSTIESVIGLVASGIGWTILTPVCVRKCLHLLPALRLQPVPGQAFSRKILLATRKTELDPHAERAAQICRTVLQKTYAPSLYRLAPWMKAAFVPK